MSAQISYGKATATILDTFTQLWHGKTVAPAIDTSAQLWHGKARATVSNTSAQLGARQSPSFTNLLARVKAWQTLATISPSVHLVHCTKKWLSLSRQLTHLYAIKLPTLILTTTLQQCSIQSTYDSLLWTALALQHLAHVWLAVWASNCIDAPPVNPTYCQNQDFN